LALTMDKLRSGGAENLRSGAAYSGSRLTQIDGLRAVAALVVVAYHYTTRFEQRFMHVSPLEISVPWGYFGVNLFFAISGFVICMTLDRCRTPQDFIVSRFARLYPTYWVAVALTWLTIQLHTMPGYAISLKAAIANLSMVHAFFGIPDVDGVYWSLQVELLFYIWMLAIWSLGLLRHTVGVCFAWTGLAVAYGVARYVFDTPVPDSIPQFLLLDYIPWFVIGMTMYVTLRGEGRWRFSHFVLLALCIIAIGLRGESEYIIAALLTMSLVLLASRNQLAWLALRPLVYLGAISYPLYLIHQKIGWAVLLQVEPQLPSVWLAIALAVFCSIAIASALHWLVEDPSRKVLRSAFARHRSRNRGGPVMARETPWFPRWATAVSALVVALFAGNIVVGRINPAVTPAPSHYMLSLFTVPHTAIEIPCHAANGISTRLVLVLGASNAASQVSPGVSDVVKIYRNGHCWRLRDALPGLDRGGLSVWSRVAELAVASPEEYDLMFAPLAIGGANISEWTGSGALNSALRHELEDLREGALQGLRVSAVVWQDEEADAVAGTDAGEYRDELLALRKLIDDYGVSAPILVGKSTACLTSVSTSLHRAIDAALRVGNGLRPGADTDSLGEAYRDSSHCRFNARGRNIAARRWWAVLAPELGKA
jgi:peptidoglycan/LPS O-acetylase OafA/YrhL